MVPPPPISQDFKGCCLTTANMRPLPLENPGYAPEPPFPPVVGRFELKIKCRQTLGPNPGRT